MNIIPTNERLILEGKSCILLSWNECDRNSYVNIKNRLYRILDVEQVCVCDIAKQHWKLLGFKSNRKCDEALKNEFEFDELIYMHWIAYMSHL